MSPRDSGRARGKPRTRKVKSAEERAVPQQTLRRSSPAFPESVAILRRLARKDLLDLGRRKGLKGRSRLKKEELVRALWTLLKIPAPKTDTPPSPGLPDWENAPLPDAYGRDRLVLMPIDPYWVHTYWEVGVQSVPGARGGPDRESGQARWVLRVYDVTVADLGGTNAPNSFDVKITPEARNWYINLWSPGRSLCAELGLVHRDGTFSPLVRSNVIQTPPAWASLEREEHRMPVGGEDLIPRQALPPRETFEPTPRVGLPQPSFPRSRAALEWSSPVPFQSSPQESSPHPGSEPTEIPLHPREAVRAEEYRRFLEGTRRARIIGKVDPGPPMLRPPPVQHGVGVPDTGPSSNEFVKEGWRARGSPTVSFVGSSPEDTRCRTSGSGEGLEAADDEGCLCPLVPHASAAGLAGWMGRSSCDLFALAEKSLRRAKELLSRLQRKRGIHAWKVVQ